MIKLSIIEVKKKKRKKRLQILWRCKKLKVQSLCVLLVYQFGILEWQYGEASGSLILGSHFLVWLQNFRRSIIFRYVGVIVTYFCAGLPKRLTLGFSSIPDCIRWFYYEVASILILDSTILFSVFLFTAVQFMLDTTMHIYKCGTFKSVVCSSLRNILNLSVFLCVILFIKVYIHCALFYLSHKVA
jgi:hypothetical protein